MSSEPQPPADHDRSGPDVAAAVGRAEEGTAVDRTHRPPGAPGTSALEQAAGSAEPGTADGGVGRGPGPDPAAAGSGGAQSQVGARLSDRAAAGQELPPDPSAG